MVPIYLDGPAAHKGVWKGQGTDRSEEGHLYMDKHSRTKFGVKVLTSDACTDADKSNRPAMGAFCGNESHVSDSTIDTKSDDEHIGYWEFKIGHLLITERWKEKFRGERLLWRCDNMIAIAAISKGYSGLDSVDRLLPSLGEALWEAEIDLAAIHIPGVWNYKADALSRRRLAPRTCEYIFRQNHVEEIEALLRSETRSANPFTGHTLDGYASATTSKCELFCSEDNKFEDTALTGHDVWLSCDYRDASPALDHLFEQKIRDESIRATILLPHWPSAYWYRRLSSSCVRIKTYPAGSNLFDAQRTTSVVTDNHSAPPVSAGLTRWPLDVWRLR
jgi:hypothetical protein